MWPFRQRVAASAEPPKPRLDAWSNALTGLGTARDKAIAGNFYPNARLMDPDLTALYHHSAIARRIVDIGPKEALRRGYDLCLKGDEESVEKLEGLKKASEKLNVDWLVREAAIWGGLFGGTLLVLGADDGQDPSEPLAEDRIKSVRWINLVDRRFIWPAKYYDDPLAPKYGDPEVYRITNAVGSVSAVTLVHETRCIRFDGARTDLLERRMLAGWTYSVLQGPIDYLRAFEQAYQAVSHLATDASQGVFKMKGLLDAMAANSAQVATRMQLIDMSRSAARAVVVDSDTEDFARMTTSFAGLPDVLDRFMMLLSAATEIPVTLLMGRSAAGMNATGDSDFRHFYDKIAQDQKDIYGPKLERLYRLLALAKDTPVRLKDPEFEMRWRPLWQPTDAEQAAIELQHAQKDQIYIVQGVLTPEEVAICRYGTGEWSGHTAIDPSERKSAMTSMQSYDPYENDPEAEPMQEAPIAGEPNQPAVPAPQTGAPSDDEGKRNRVKE